MSPRRSCPNLYMQYSNNTIYSTYSIRDDLPSDVRDYLLVAHAITGCDIVSAMYNVGKKALAVLENYECNFLDIFKENEATHDKIARAGEMFLLKPYNAKETCVSLDNLRFSSYRLTQMMKKTKKKRKSSSIASFKLECSPPTTAAAKYHAYRAYLAVQEWLGNSLQATDWGWEYNDDMPSPVYTDRPAASDSVLNM